jgi:hypothetical protein
VLPAAGCRVHAPAWPVGDPTEDELATWRHLWALPVAAWWHEQHVSPGVVARYVTLRIAKPEHAATGQLERELALTPASAARAKLVVGRVQAKKTRVDSPYADMLKEIGATSGH